MGDAHLVQLVDMGLPNDTHSQWHTPVHADRVPMKSAHQIQFQEGKYYSVLGPWWQDGVLWVTGPHFDHGCCRVAQDISDVTQGWIELFCGGMGAWSFAASKLHKAVHVAVDNDPVACTGYRLNHGVAPFCCSVGQAIWVPSEPREGILASPPCPIFSNFTGAQGFQSNIGATDGWSEMMTMLRFVQPPVFLLENPTSMHKRLNEVREYMRVVGYKLVQVQAVQLGDFGPMKRDRSISIWARVYDHRFLQVDHQHPWLPKGQYHTLLSFQCLAPINLLTDELHITDQHRMILTDPGINGGSTKASAWCKHQIFPGQQAPTIQCKYVANLRMNPVFLKRFGLHCPVLVSPESLQPRYFSPWEVTRAFLYPPGVVIPASAFQAWPILGNSVSPLQCAVGLIGVDLALGRITRTEADSVLLTFVRDALPLKGDVVVVQEGWVTLAVPNPNAPDNDLNQSTPSSPDSLRSDDSRLGVGQRQEWDCELLDSPGAQSPRSSISLDRSPMCSPVIVTTPEKQMHTELFLRISGETEPNNCLTIPPNDSTDLVPMSSEHATQVSEHSPRFNLGVVAPTSPTLEYPVAASPPEPHESVATKCTPACLLPHGSQDDLGADVLPDTIRWKPILSTLEIMASIEGPNSQSNEYLNRKALVSRDMSRPIGASSNPMATLDDDEEEFGGIPEPRTPPPSDTRSRSPLPRLRQAFEGEEDDPLPAGVTRVVIKTKITTETIQVHRTHPLATIKILLALVDSTQCTRLEYKHAALASHTRVGSIPQGGYLFASWRRPSFLFTAPVRSMMVQ